MAVGLVVLFALKAIRNKKINRVKAEVLALEAKLSQLRLALKGKVRKKSTIFRSSFQTAIIKDDMIDTALRQLSEIQFESTSEFQDYFDISKKIVDFSQIGKTANGNVAEKIENSFMCSDFKTEMDIAKIIKDMYVLSTKINEKIDTYNNSRGVVEIEKVDSMNFPSLGEINKIFSMDEVNRQAKNSAA